MCTWHILGAGALGRLFAFFLSRHGCDVTLITRRAINSQLNCAPEIRKSVTIRYTSEKEVKMVNVKWLMANELSPGSVQRLLVATKAADAVGAVFSVKAALKKNAKLILTQNGLGSQQQICESLPAHSVWAASVTHGAWTKDATSDVASLPVYHAGAGEIQLGLLQMMQDAPGIFSVNEFPFHAFNVSWCDDILEKLWGKLAINSIINPLTILYNCENGELLKHKYATVVRMLIAEAQTILGIEGFSAGDLPHRVHTVMEKTASNISSSLQDFRKKRPTELPFINGRLLHIAGLQQITLPENQRIKQRLALQGVIY